MNDRGMGLQQNPVVELHINKMQSMNDDLLPKL